MRVVAQGRQYVLDGHLRNEDSANPIVNQPGWDSSWHFRADGQDDNFTRPNTYLTVWCFVDPEEDIARIETLLHPLICGLDILRPCFQRGRFKAGGVNRARE